MSACDKCGNEYDKTFRVEVAGKSYTFDRFECAISMLAPRCSHCDCIRIGHGVEAGNIIYCCDHCAKHEGLEGLKDRA